MWNSGTKNPTYRALYLRIAAIKKLIAVKTFCLEKTTFGFLPQIMESVLISFYYFSKGFFFFHNYCGELLCLVSTHLCLLCHFYVVYELFISFWVEFCTPLLFLNLNDVTMSWQNLGLRALGKWKLENSK